MSTLSTIQAQRAEVIQREADLTERYERGGVDADGLLDESTRLNLQLQALTHAEIAERRRLAGASGPAPWVVNLLAILAGAAAWGAIG